MIRADLGNDWIIGSAGADYIDGGAGVDTVDYSTSPSNITIENVWPSRYFDASSGHADGDVLIDIEHIIGSPFNDFIDVGDAGETPNFVHGGGGDDELCGYVNDHLSGGSGDDELVTFYGGTARGGTGSDTFVFVGETRDATVEDFSTDDGDMIRLAGEAFEGVTQSDVQEDA